MSTGLTPSAEAKLLEWKSCALGLLAKAAEKGFDQRDCETLSHLLDATRSFFGYRSFARMSQDIGVSARVVADRAKRPQFTPSLFNYQRTLSGLVRVFDRALTNGNIDAGDAKIDLRAEWRPVPSSLREKMFHVSDLLATIVTQLRGINDNTFLSDGFEEVDKEYLIQLLETTLTILRAPMVEVGLLKRSARWLGHLSSKAADRVTMAALGAAASEGAHELLGVIFKMHGS